MKREDVLSREGLPPAPAPPAGRWSKPRRRARSALSERVSETGSAQPTKIMGLEAAQSQVSGENT